MFSTTEQHLTIRLNPRWSVLLLAFAVLLLWALPAEADGEPEEPEQQSSEAPAEDSERGGTAEGDEFQYQRSERKQQDSEGDDRPDDAGDRTRRISKDASVPRVPDFITRLAKARDHGGYTCSGNVCRASRTACSAAPDYVVANGDVVATPRASGPRAPGSVTYESITRETATGADSSNGYTCLTPSDAAPGNGGDGGGAAEPAVITMTVTDFASLPVQPLVASAGPEDGWLPVGMVNVLYADPEVQTLETEILGIPFSVRAIPTEYHWDLGDGNTITTTKPGKPFPSEEISAAYVAEGWYDITLTTTFAGQFSVAGGEWQDIDGTIEVASDPIALFSKSLEARLVDGDVPVDEEEDPWVPERTSETEGPRDPDARQREI